ncbi:MAG TPA: DnaJ domain-containing protein [Ktedonobacterales bacterium]
MAEEPDYYAALGLTPAADEAAIRAAYRRLARRYHPDVAGPAGLPRMRALNAAYAILGDPEQRAAYDQRHGFAIAPSPAPSTPRPTPMPRAGSLRASAGPFQRIVTLDAPPMPVAALALAGQSGTLALGLLDGHLALRAIPSGAVLATLDFGPRAGAGVLQEVRLSHGGRLAAAWGFSLGLRVWEVATRAPLWNTALSAPSDLLDLALAEHPPFAALATPDAPLALATDDPFRWAHEGRGGSAIYFRPLSGLIAPNWANPLHCAAAGAGGGLFGPARGEGWRVRARLLAAHGRALLTLAESAQGETQIVTWNLMRRTLRGAIAPRQEYRHLEAARLVRLPLAATPDLARVALVLGEGALRLLSPREGRHSTLLVGELPEDPRLALSADGAWLALGRDDQLDLWNVETGQHAQAWRFGAEVTALAFGAGGGRALLAVGLANGLAEVWG